MMQLNNLFSNFKIWIIIFFVIRLAGITQPPLETIHNWRQTTVTMVARNFYETDANILYPRIDIAGEKSGITGMEFPLLNYGIFLMAKALGYSHWYGRLINLIISSLGIFFFYKLTRMFMSEQAAFYSGIILLVSIWFSFSRKIMPDTFSTSLVIMGMYCAILFLQKDCGRYFQLFLYMVLIMAGALSKLPALILAPALLIPFLYSTVRVKRRSLFAVVTALALTPAGWWYFVHVPFLNESFGFLHFFMGVGMVQGASELWTHANAAFAHFYSDALKYSGFIVFIAGVVFSVINRNKLLLATLALTGASIFIVMLISGYTFAHHSYYIVPFVPVMAALAGYGLSQLPRKLAMILLIAIATEGLLDQQHDFRINADKLALLELEKDLDKFSLRNDLILINSGEYPTPMYFAHRKGWVNSNDQLTPENIEVLRSKGLKYVVILKKTFGSYIKLPLPELLSNENYTLYKAW